MTEVIETSTQVETSDLGKASSSALPRSPSRNVLDPTGAAIATAETPQIENGTDHAAVFAKREAVPSISLPRQSTDVRHFAMDMGGSLVKIVYFSPDSEKSTGAQTYASPLSWEEVELHFRKFETSKLDQCMNFIEQKRLHLVLRVGKQW